MQIKSQMHASGQLQVIIYVIQMKMQMQMQMQMQVVGQLKIVICLIQMQKKANGQLRIIKSLIREVSFKAKSMNTQLSPRLCFVKALALKFLLAIRN